MRLDEFRTLVALEDSYINEVCLLNDEVRLTGEFFSLRDCDETTMVWRFGTISFSGVSHYHLAVDLKGQRERPNGRYDLGSPDIEPETDRCAIFLSNARWNEGNPPHLLLFGEAIVIEAELGPILERVRRASGSEEISD